MKKQRTRRRYKDYIGKTVYGLKIIRELKPGAKNVNPIWEIECYCGKIFTSNPGYIFSKYGAKSCGCNMRKLLKGNKHNYIDRTNEEYKGLTFIADSGIRGKGGSVKWNMKCYCGKMFLANARDIYNGNVSSCGCFRTKFLKEKIGPKHHCYNPNLTEEDRKYTRGRRETLKKEALKRDGYCCRVCKSNVKLIAHHLNGHNWAKSERCDINNLVIICNLCHKEFHSKFGIKDNTRGQFKEFLNTKQDITLYDEGI